MKLVRAGRFGWRYLLGLIFLFYVLLTLGANHRFRSIVVHHTATKKGDFSSIRRAHGRWGDVAYHLVLSNGSSDVPLGYLESGARYFSLTPSVATRSKRCNLFDIHICLVGNYEEGALPQPMREALAAALKSIGDRYHIPSDRVRLHRDCSATACPGKNINSADLMKWAGLAQNCDPAVVAQQKQIVAKPFLGPFPIGLFLFTLPFCVGGSLVWLFFAHRLARRKRTLQ